MEKIINFTIRFLAIVCLSAVLTATAAKTAHCVDYHKFPLTPLPQATCDEDSDSDGLMDCEEDVNKNGVWDENLGETDFQNADTDGDGLLDGEEGDRDGDGELGPDESDPLLADTDGDGVEDGDEARAGTLRNTCDTDEDGLSDGVEMGAIGPDDVNGCHGLQAAGTNFHNPYALDPLNPDSDADGLKDGEEDLNGNGWLDPDDTDPTRVDTDRDGIEDGVEALGDFDGDGIPDFDYKLVQGEGDCRPPQSISDLDCDGVPNARDDDSDNDGCPDGLEGSWLDSNANGIPDIFDNEAMTCPEPSANGGGATGGGTSQEQGDSSTSTGVSMYSADGADGAACSLSLYLNKTDFSLCYLNFLLFLVLVGFFTRPKKPALNS
ncbi:MAG: hypothetical protein ABH871_08500 [Pseudomonadota bacterium]